MADNDNKVDALHDKIPAMFNSRDNENWVALLGAIGESDQYVADLVESVRKQFFVKTAERPYLDRLGAKSRVQRPELVGIGDQSFRKFIPLMAYQPKQVKVIIDKLLDLFFFKDATTSFIMSSGYEDFFIQDGWTLEYLVDGYKEEIVTFREDQFVDIANATASEIVASINRQAQYSYAVLYEDNITKRRLIRIFTSTIGSKGSIQLTGGLSNISFRFEGFNQDAGNGADTEWVINKIGSTVTMYYTGVGNTPNLNKVSIGDIVLINIPGISGSFEIKDINIGEQRFSFDSTFAIGGDGSTPYCHLASGGSQSVCELNGGVWLEFARTYQQISDIQVKFMSKYTAHIHGNDRRALTWEVKANEIDVEMPATPPIVQRRRKGGTFLNGIESIMLDRLSDTSMELQDASAFPDAGGRFYMEEISEIRQVIPNESTIDIHTIDGRRIYGHTFYTYSSKSGNVLNGISPNLPELSSINQFNLVSANRDSNNVLTIITSTAHNYAIGDTAIVSNTVINTGTTTPDGSWTIKEIVNSFTIMVESVGDVMTSSSGNVRVEKPGMSLSGSRVTLTTATVNDGSKFGAYMWDMDSPYVLSSFTTRLSSAINAGTTQRNVLVEPSDMPNQEGRLIFDFGTSKEEGPVRYFYAPTNSTIAIDPSYVFKFTHNTGSYVTMIRSRGGKVMSGSGAEYPAYITDPGVARQALQNLIKEVKSVGIFVNFIVRYPEQFYNLYPTYGQDQE